ncbi:integrase core domain-containing protein, partial [Escherichia coli]
ALTFQNHTDCPLTDFGGKTSIFSHPVYLFLRKFSLQDSRGGSQRLKEAGLLASTGSTGDSYDNAMAESINGLYKAEVIHRKSWKNRAEVELATLTWVDWYNNRRLLGRLGHTPPAEAEKAHYASIGNNDLAA